MILAAQSPIDTVALLNGYDANADAAGYVFDTGRAEDAIWWIQENCTHIKGPLGGQPFLLQPWQQALIATLFGWICATVTQATVDLDGCCHPLRKKFFYCVCNYNVEQFVDSNAYGVPSQLALFKEFTDNYRYDGYNYPLQGYDSPIFFISLIVFKWHVRRHSPFLAFSCDHEGLQSLYQLLV